MNRVIDLSAALVLLLLLLPLLLLLGASVYLRLGAPVLFSQERVGRKGVVFKILKFRSMLESNEAGGKPVRDELRMTSFGRFLRASSLDELPELWNVIRGDMSFVGPRPLLTEYLPLYTPHQSRRHDVRPGITGWAQVNGRNAISWEDRFELDVWYVDNKSLWLDIKILALTLCRLLDRKGISAPGHVTMPKFTGSRSGNGGP